jgi:predicted nucleic acid-binding protein
MKIIKNSKVYLDANFLVAYLIPAKREKDKVYNEKAQKAFAWLIVNNCKMYLSSLVFDEFWNSVRKEAGVKRIRNKLRFYISGFLQNFGIRGLIDAGVDYYTHYELYSDLRKYTGEILSFPKVKIVQFNNIIDGIKQALENIKQYQMKPRDAFHLSLMQNLQIPFILTQDPKFLNIEPESGIIGEGFLCH